MPKTERIELRVTPEMRAAIDTARGDVPLNRWAERAFEKALSEAPGRVYRAANSTTTDGSVRLPDRPAVRSSAQARAGVRPIPKAGKR